MRIPRKEIEKLLNAGYVEKKNANETFNYILLYIIISSYALSNTLRTNIIRKDEFWIVKVQTLPFEISRMLQFLFLSAMKIIQV